MEESIPAVYRSDDNIENLCIKVDIRKKSSLCAIATQFTPKEGKSLETDAAVQTSLVASNATGTLTGENTAKYDSASQYLSSLLDGKVLDSSRQISWQEKIFGPRFVPQDTVFCIILDGFALLFLQDLCDTLVALLLILLHLFISLFTLQREDLLLPRSQSGVRESKHI